MDKYRRVDKKAKLETAPDEIRVTLQGGSERKSISQACALLSPRPDEKESEHRSLPKFRRIVIKAMGRAMSKAVTVAEGVKLEAPGIHQVVKIYTCELQEVFEPLEEGLDRLVLPRFIPAIEVVLSLDVALVDTLAPGYQPPLSEAERQVQYWIACLLITDCTVQSL